MAALTKDLIVDLIVVDDVVWVIELRETRGAAVQWIPNVGPLPVRDVRDSAQDCELHPVLLHAVELSDPADDLIQAVHGEPL